MKISNKKSLFFWLFLIIFPISFDEKDKNYQYLLSFVEEIIKVNNTALAIVLIAFAVVLIGGLVVIPAIQEAQAKGPPAKAQAILAAEPSERGAVASGGQGGGGPPCELCG
jgi:hypothetical protein